MRNSIFLIFVFGLTISAQASVKLQVGDILLQPLSCWSCALIELEEKTRYAHSGLVVSVEPLLVAESISETHAIPYEYFRARNKKNEQLKVLRFKDKRLHTKLKRGFYQRFIRDYKGLKFDPHFLWNNVDIDGRELMYCSEFISKILEAHLNISMPIKRMQFLENRDYWNQYFNGRIPDGEWGNSPADFEKSDLFFTAGYL